MPTHTATIELTDDEAAVMLRTAQYFKMSLPDFLRAALQSGIAHAEQRVPDDVLAAPDDDLNEPLPF